MPLDLEDVDIKKELELEEKAEQTPQVTETPPKEDAAPVEAPPTEEPKAEGAEPETPPSAEHKTKQVPLPALQEARREAKELRERLRRSEMENQQRFAALQERLNKLQTPEGEQPTFETDPASYLKKEVEGLKQAVTTATQQAQQVQIESFLKNTIQASEDQYRKNHPDYNDAVNHLIASLKNNMELHGVSDQAQIDNMLKEQATRMTVTALRLGKEPAEFVYEIAKNHGFVPKAVRDNETKLETIAKGQEATQTLGSGGKRDSGAVTLDSLSKMDDGELDALLLDDKKWAQIAKLMH